MTISIIGPQIARVLYPFFAMFIATFDIFYVSILQVLSEQMPELLDFDKDLVHLEAASKVLYVLINMQLTFSYPWSHLKFLIILDVICDLWEEYF